MSAGEHGSLALEWAGVIDNEEAGSGFPRHGPIGNMHILVYEAGMSCPAETSSFPPPLREMIMPGPYECEWRDGDERSFDELEIWPWRSPDDRVTVLVYESDPQKPTIWGVEIPLKIGCWRKHAVIFCREVSRADTLDDSTTYYVSKERCSDDVTVRPKWLKELKGKLSSSEEVFMEDKGPKAIIAFTTVDMANQFVSCEPSSSTSTMAFY